jgi:hypothetical protein
MPPKGHCRRVTAWPWIAVKLTSLASRTVVPWPQKPERATEAAAHGARSAELLGCKESQLKVGLDGVVKSFANASLNLDAEFFS